MDTLHYTDTHKYGRKSFSFNGKNGYDKTSQHIISFERGKQRAKETNRSMNKADNK